MVNPACIHSKPRYRCKLCNPNKYCTHSKIKYSCKQCLELQICSHGAKYKECIIPRCKFRIPDSKILCKHKKPNKKCKLCKEFIAYRNSDTSIVIATIEKDQYARYIHQRTSLGNLVPDFYLGKDTISKGTTIVKLTNQSGTTTAVIPELDLSDTIDSPVVPVKPMKYADCVATGVANTTMADLAAATATAIAPKVAIDVCQHNEPGWCIECIL